MNGERLILRLAGMVALLLLAACATHHPIPQPPAPPRPTTNLNVCLSTLANRGVEVRKVSDWHTASGCGIAQAVRVVHSEIDWNQQLLMTCGLELSLSQFEESVVQPEARRYFGREVTKMWNLGSYACRDEIGGSHVRLSQHAYGNAIDISGFDLQGGITVRVKRDWNGDDAKALFLHAVAAGACRIFQAVLTPKTNSSHYDHIHMDLGSYRECDA